jgi:hypothetical protein
MTTTVTPSADPLSALVLQLPAIDARDRVTLHAGDETEVIEERLQIAEDVRLVRRTGEFYVALVEAGHHLVPHLLDVGLGRLVWTLATARPTGSFERARRVLAECGIVASLKSETILEANR